MLIARTNGGFVPQVTTPGSPHTGFATGDFAYFFGSVTFDRRNLGVITSLA